MGGPGSGRVSKKLPDERMGHGSTTETDPRYLTTSKAPFIPVPVIPEPSPRWAPIVQSWYRSLQYSGQTKLWQASDWTTAVLAAQTYDRFLKTDNGSILISAVRMIEMLGVTDVLRKRARIELTNEVEVDQDEERGKQSVISWKGRLGVVKDK